MGIGWGVASTSVYYLELRSPRPQLVVESELSAT